MSARKLSGTLRAVRQFPSEKSPEETELVCISECNILKRDLLVSLTCHAKGNDFRKSYQGGDDHQPVPPGHAVVISSAAT